MATPQPSAMSPTSVIDPSPTKSSESTFSAWLLARKPLGRIACCPFLVWRATAAVLGYFDAHVRPPVTATDGFGTRNRLIDPVGV